MIMGLKDLTEVLKPLSLWGCKFEETIFYEIYCNPNKQMIMTIDDLRNTKVYVDTLEHSVLIQKLVFAMGGMWANGTLGIDDVLEEPRTYLISENLLLTYQKGNYPSIHRYIPISDILGKENKSLDDQTF